MRCNAQSILLSDSNKNSFYTNFSIYNDKTDPTIILKCLPQKQKNLKAPSNEETLFPGMFLGRAKVGNNVSLRCYPRNISLETDVCACSIWEIQPARPQNPLNIVPQHANKKPLLRTQNVSEKHQKYFLFLGNQKNSFRNKCLVRAQTGKHRENMFPQQCFCIFLVCSGLKPFLRPLDKIPCSSPK